VPALCPFCAARQSLKVWESIDSRLFATPDHAAIQAAHPGTGRTRALSFAEAVAAPKRPRLLGTVMLDRTITYTVPVAPDALPVNLAAFLNFRLSRAVKQGVRTRRRSAATPSRNNEIARFRKIGVTGGVDAMHVGLGYDRSPDGLAAAEGRGLDPVSWKVEFRQVMFVPAEKADAVTRNLVMPAPAGSKLSHSAATVDRVDEPDRFQVMNAFASALRVSRVPMFAPLPLVEQYVRARYGRRLVATFGSLHGNAR
jgi:hypothetical protein